MKFRILCAILGFTMFLIGAILNPKILVTDSVFGWLGIAFYFITVLSYLKFLINFQNNNKYDDINN